MLEPGAPIVIFPNGRVLVQPVFCTYLKTLGETPDCTIHGCAADSTVSVLDSSTPDECDDHGYFKFPICPSDATTSENLVYAQGLSFERS